MLKLTEINIEILEWAIDYSCKGNALTLKFPKLKKWINRDDYPTVKQLEKFAKATNVPFGYFFLQSIPRIELPIPFFRTESNEIERNFSPELIDSVRIIEQRKDWLREYFLSIGVEPLRFVASKSVNDNYKDVAKNIRDVIGLHDNWASQHVNWEAALNFLVDKTEEIGINVIRNGIVGNNTHRKLDYREFRGFVLVDEYAPFLFINGTDFKSAQMFTLAHELAHIWLGSSAAFDLRAMLPAKDNTERFCDKVAAELLVPEEEIMQKWEEVKSSEAPYTSLAKLFKVSELVVARKILSLDKITQSDFLNFYSEYLTRVVNKKKNDGGDFYNNQPYRIGKRFANSVFSAAKEGVLLYRDAYRLTGLSAKAFKKFETRMYS